MSPEIHQASARLAGEPLEEVATLFGGRNSPVRRYRSASGRDLVGKTYASRPRQDREVAALEFLGDLPGFRVPALLGVDREARVCLLEYLSGEAPADPGPGDVAHLVAFLGALGSHRTPEVRAALPAASEACPTLAELEANLEARRDRLRELADPVPGIEPEFRDFLEGVLTEKTREHLERARGLLGPRADLTPEQRILSPSDLGFHNSLRLADGSLALLDFEHFGWDDPAKTACDFLLHPGMELSRELRQAFARGLAVELGAEAWLGDRVRALLPLYGAKWALILLNEFLPTARERRAAAGSPGEPSEVQARQLRAARELLRDATSPGESLVD